MPREIELKLEIDPAYAERLFDAPQLRGEPRRERLISVYYDTPKRKLRRHGWTLRVRQHEAGFTQTIKSDGNRSGQFERDECECEVASLQPDWAVLKKTPVAALVDRRQFRQIAPVFRTDVERSTWQVTTRDCSVEAAFDDGWIQAGSKTERIHELELELKGGNDGKLLRLARGLNTRIPVKLGVSSKAERGFALAEGGAALPTKATMVALDGDASVTEGFATIATACIKHFRLNEPIFVDERDAEALHQMRVAIRRLRTAMWLFKPATNDTQFAPLNDKLRRFTRELGAARNIDVILNSMPSGDPARDQLERDREHLYARILKKLSGRPFRTMMIDLLGWALEGEWRVGRRAGRRLLPFARKRLDRLWRRIEERARKLASLPKAERHKLRIDTKKIRYALEFLRDALAASDGERKQFGAAAEGVQDSLGLLNDLAIRRQLVRGSAWQSRNRNPDGEEAARHLRAAKRCLRKMKDVGPYWRQPD